jgi:hypothetical protein
MSIHCIIKFIIIFNVSIKLKKWIKLNNEMKDMWSQHYYELK